MDKKVILAVAGSGKTSYIVEQLDLEKNHLLITYAINNVQNLRTKIIKKWGYFPENIRLFSYYNFLYAFCYKPYLHREFEAKGINFQQKASRWAKNSQRYIDSGNRLYSNRIPKFFEIQSVLTSIENRLSKYFDQILIDEIQDFAGHDFNFLKTLAKANTDIFFVGDFHQHTFDTSRDGNVNKNLHNSFLDYQKFFNEMGMELDADRLKKSYRCSATVCDFISEKLDIKIESHRNDETKIEFVEKKDEADIIFADQSIVKIFYQNHHKYGCYSRNWGGCKGEDHYQDICVVLNPKSLQEYKKDELAGLAPKTKSKLYVALTRARGDIYFVPENLFKKLN